MKRRNFIGITATSLGGIMVVPQFLTSCGLLKKKIAPENDNILIFVQLNGGNDGLNTFIPYNDPLYYSKRPKIGIEKSKVLPLINNMGLHPSLIGLSQIANDGNLSIIQNVGYPNNTRSHFRTQDIWTTASDADIILTDGWLGRFLAIECENDILSSINLDNRDALALKNVNSSGLTISDFQKLEVLNNHSGEDYKLSDNPQLDFVRKISFSSIEGYEEIQKSISKSKDVLNKYPKGEFNQNMFWIMRLILGGFQSKVYYTSLEGFDTHSNQIQNHAKILTSLDTGIYSLYADLKKHQLLNRVTVVVFSEFGRRVAENGSGTDHGAAGPMFIIGGNNKGRVIGNNPNLDTLDDGDLIYDIDFRSVYASILKNKYNFDPELINIKQKPLNDIF
jgi:uncharacterized protein (DUF1501 family)